MHGKVKLTRSGKGFWKRTLILIAICTVWTLVIVWLHLKIGDDQMPKGMARALSSQLDDAEYRAQDRLFRNGRKVAPDDEIVLLGVTRAAYADVPLENDPDAAASPTLLAMRDNFPWPRFVWADLIDRLAGAGARVIALDFVFPSPTEHDDALRAALERHRDKVVVASFFSGDLIQGGLSLTLPAETIVPRTEASTSAFDPRVGYISIWPDLDGVVRRHRYSIPDAELVRIDYPSPNHEAFTARILRQMGQTDRIPASKTPLRFRYTTAPGAFWKPIPINEVFYPHLWAGTFKSGEFFRDKVVIVGPTAPLFHDEHPTPFMASHGMMLGPEIHINLLNAALRGEFLNEPALGSQLATIIGAGLLCLILGLGLPMAFVRLVVSANLFVLYILGVQLVFDRMNTIMLTAAPLLVFGAASLSTFAYDFMVERLARRDLRRTMGQYFSPRVMEAVLANPGSMEPREASVTLLLTDLRNSTPLAEKLGPKGMFDLLNRVFEIQTNAIMAEEGNLEHFLGDQFLSYWGAPSPQPDAPGQALRAARKLISGMEKLRPTLPEDIAKLFGYGVALHCGEVLVGNKGSAQRLDYGLVGDTVNAAARIESLTRMYGVTLIVSGDFLAHWQGTEPTRLLDVVQVKGRTQPVELYEIIDPTSGEEREIVFHDYQTAFASYQAGQFAAAAEAFRKLAAASADPPSQLLAERARQLQQQPPANWNGIWKLDRKE